jgi:methionine-rich copper-binding protein CopC
MKLKTIILLALLFSLFVSPVQAHTELVSVDPASETAMLTYPVEIKLTFGEAIIADATFASITSESGSVEATLRVEAANVYISIPSDLVAPEITVAWKTAASDGHPLDGEIKYFLAQEKAEPAASPTEEIVEEEVVAISAPVEPSSSNISWLQWLSLGASIGIAITFFLKMRKK